MKKISYVIGSYYGNRRFTHSSFPDNRLFYIQTNLEYLNKQTTPIYKIYITCTFDDISRKVENGQPIVNNRDFIMSELTKLAAADERIVLLERPNISGTYHAWQMALHTDSNDSDYIMLAEDDYTLYDENALKYMMEFWEEDPDLLYLCQYWNTHVFNKNGVSVSEHAGISNGIINNKLYNEMKQLHNIDFLLVSDTNIWMNQCTFMENFRLHGAKFKDIRNKYSCLFAHSAENIEEFGVATGIKIILPIVDKFF